MNNKQKSQIQIINNFLNNVKQDLSKISKKSNKINIFEITGMENQEIKHSNFLSWLFEFNHNEILFDFLKKVFQHDIDLLRYTESRINGPIHIYREKEDIDILIEDISNSKIFVIENKVNSSESKNQLQKYESISTKLYPSIDCKIYYIYLAKLDSKKPSSGKWALANYNDLSEVLLKYLKDNKKKLKDEIKILIDNYLDLLKKKKIMKNKDLETLCHTIWKNSEYREALNILYDHMPKVDDRLKKVGEKYGTPLVLIREYTPKGGIKEEHEVILKSDYLLWFDGEPFSTPNTLINNGIKLKVNKVKGGSGQDSLSQFKIKNTGKKLCDKEFPKLFKKKKRK
ncbi:MAG: hypothetical protein CMD02_00910 [Flavobacteriales bacterium]|nr:hypothetical protein [Flavobacteriales bacterium]